jgi:hypothetical protein
VSYTGEACLPVVTDEMLRDALHGIRVSIFDADPDEVDQIMRQDPGVQAGLFSYELHATRTFPQSTPAGTSAAG